jgi:RimJ/RimL family protein N-acetyltransferase
VVEGDEPDKIVGAVYMTKPPKPSVAGNEIGIFILRECQGHGYGPRAIKLLMEKHGNIRYLANIAPTNEISIKMFEGLGFKLVQHTYSLEAE